MKKRKTFKTQMLDNCNSDFQKKPQKFEVAVVGLQTVNGRYVLNNGQENAALVVKGDKKFTMTHAVAIANQVNDYKPNLSTGEFSITLDGIKFNCNVQKV